MSAAASEVNVFAPIDWSKIVIEEKEDILNFSGKKLRHRLTIIPWRSLYYAGKLDCLDALPKDARQTTILKWGMEFPEINNKIITLGFKNLFCTSTDLSFPVRNYLFPDFVKESIYCSHNKDILFSFIGWENNRLRRRIFELYGHLPSVIRRDEYDSSSRNKAHETEYSSILARSRFSLCPEGVTSGTKRFWESLKAGSIPILVSRKLELPKRPCVGQLWNWCDIAIRIAPWQVMEGRDKITLATVLPRGREEELRTNCLRAASDLARPDFLIKYIDTTLDGNL